MSKSDKQPIKNAAEIIEAYGGIRPMSAKINVAVTTIQGWKKRNVIPAARKKIILESAANHNIDLSAFFEEAPSVSSRDSEIEPESNLEATFIPEDLAGVNTEDGKENDGDSAAPDEKEDGAEKESESEVIEVMSVAPAIDMVTSREDEFKEPSRQAQHKDFTEIAIETERKAITKSALIAAAMFLVVLAAIVVMLWPDFEEFEERGGRIAALEGDVSDIKDRQSSFKGLVPENWSKQLDDLKQQVGQAKKAVGDTVESVQNASQQFIEENGLEERVVQLQSYVTEIASEYGLLTHFEKMENSDPGQKALDNSVLQLSSILAQTKGKDDSYVNNVLDSARSKSAALNQTLGNVPKDELKAAAMLLALTQVRSALNRSEEAFDEDLGLLMNMVGEENTELRSSLDKLAPHSKSGVLSAGGLQTEFRTIAGDVVAASLRGEDVSFSEKAAARMNEILQVEKDGELLTGTETQATVIKAQKMMQGGNWEEALRYLKKHLHSKELKPLEPWIKKVEGALTAKKVQKAIEEAIDLNIGSGLLGGSQLLNDKK